MAKFKFGVTLTLDEHKTARLANGPGATNNLKRLDNGKLVKLVGDSQYGLCAAGDEIEGVVVVADDVAPQDGFTIGSIADEDSTRIKVLFDGLQATPGVGTIAIGDYVVAGTPVALGTDLGTSYPKVMKGTAAGKDMIFNWRVVSFISAAGAVGETGLIERV
jgi:hypothetical protein